MAKNDKKPTYEQAVAELETIIEKIESGEIGLEESLRQYEKGMKLLCQCRDILDTAEKKIATLTAETGGLAAANADQQAQDDQADDSVTAELDEACDDQDQNDDLPF